MCFNCRAVVALLCWALQFLTDVFYLFQIDIFEQQFRSISKIDFMERYLSEVKTSNHSKLIKIDKRSR